MACERYRDALTDVAAGEPATVAVEGHLASCEACRAELLALRRALAVADAEMAGLASAEPSPGLAARIRQAVAQASEPSPDLSPRMRHELADLEPSSAWRFSWLWPAIAAAATLAVALAVVLGRDLPPKHAPVVAVGVARPQAPDRTPAAESGVRTGAPVIPRDSGPTSPEGSATSGAGETGGAGDPSSPRPTRTPRLDRAAVPPEPEVLVPTGETEALLRFAAHLRTRVVSPDSMLVADLSAPLPEPKGVEIQPLAIVPLDPAETSGTD